MCNGCEELIREKMPIINRAAFMYCEDSRILETEVNDIKSIAYLNVFKAKKRDENIASKPNAYFHEIVKNISRDMVRYHQRQLQTIDIDEVGESHSEFINECINESATNRLIISKLFELFTPREREILESIALGKSIDECAEDWGVTTTNAKQLRFRTMQSARELLPSLLEDL